MKTITNAEWERMYRLYWRGPFAHLPKDIRAKLVRGCRGKACYDSAEEALPVIAQMPVRSGLFLHAYRCPLCYNLLWEEGGPVYQANYHIGNSRNASHISERAIDPRKHVDRLHESM
jgi:hypothetical protein